MEFRERLPERFFGLFQSQNRYLYIESLLLIYDEYLYNDYFLTRDTCIRLLSDHFARRIVDVSADRIEGEEAEDEEREPAAARILNRLLYFNWLRKVEDYSNFRTNIVLPEYASMFLDVFVKLSHPEENEAETGIQNIYANVYSFCHDCRAGIELLRTARVNISKLNRSLQSLLHNMDEFFEKLLAQETYEGLLTEHLEYFVEDAVNRKYGMLKTGDNFYIYKNDIKVLLQEVAQDRGRLLALEERAAEGAAKAGQGRAEVEQEFYALLAECERGMNRMESRIAHIDAEYSRYVQATVSRLEYLLNRDDNTRGLIVELLRRIGDMDGGREAGGEGYEAGGIPGSGKRRRDEQIAAAAGLLELSDLSLLSQDSFYQRRARKSFEETVAEEERPPELSRGEVLAMNRIAQQYGTEEIEGFVSRHMEKDTFSTEDLRVESEEDFKLLILAYDYALRKNSPFGVIAADTAPLLLQNGKYAYPSLTFYKKNHDGKHDGKKIKEGEA